MQNHFACYMSELLQIQKTSHRERFLCIGEQNKFDVEEKSHLNYNLFLAPREEILTRKDLTHQLWLMMKEEKYQRIHIL